MISELRVLKDCVSIRLRLRRLAQNCTRHQAHHAQLERRQTRAETRLAEFPTQAGHERAIVAYLQDDLLGSRTLISRTFQELTQRKNEITELSVRVEENLFGFGKSIGLQLVSIAIFASIFAYDLTQYGWWKAVIFTLLRVALSFAFGAAIGWWKSRRLARENRRESSQIILPPGDEIRQFFALLMTPQTMERVIDPHLADVRHAWLDAMIRGDELAAKRIKREGYFFLVLTAGKRIFIDLVVPFSKRLIVLVKVLYAIWEHFHKEEPLERFPVGLFWRGGR